MLHTQRPEGPRTSFFGHPRPCLPWRCAQRQLPARPAAAVQPQRPDHEPLISRNKPSTTRRQALLLSTAAPALCCAACGGGSSRNAVLDRLFATSMATGMQEYEEAIAPVKRRLFGELAVAVGAAQPAGGTGSGRVLEIGIGTGPNLSYYPADSGLTITGVDPNPYMLPYLKDNAAQAGWLPERLEWVEGRAEALPLADGSVDAVVCTLVLCTVPDVPAVLREVRRVLRPGGAFLYIEHTIAPQGEPLLRLGQHLLDPLQQLLADGCHLTRDPLPAIQSAGFASVEASRFTVEGGSLIGPHVAGIALHA